MLRAHTKESDDLAMNLFQYGGLAFVIFVLAAMLFLLSSCTITQTMVHTEGTASDVVDETETTSPDVKPTTNLTIPVKAI